MTLLLSFLVGIRILFIGTHADLKQAPKIGKELNVAAKVTSFVDRNSLGRFPGRTGAYYRALWEGRYFRHYAKHLQYIPSIIVVLGRETQSGNWNQLGTLGPPPLSTNGCVNGETITCVASDIDACVNAVEETWCR